MRYTMNKVRIILCVFLMVLLPFSLKGQSAIFDKYNDKATVSSVYISKTMLQMQPNVYTKDVNIGKVAGQLEAVYIVSTMDNTLKRPMQNDIEDFIKKGKYEVLMKQKGITSSSSFYVKKKGDKVKELIMITDATTKFSYIHLIGEMTLNDIQRITSSQSLSHHISLPVLNLNEILEHVHCIDLAWLENEMMNLYIPDLDNINIAGVQIEF